MCIMTSQKQLQHISIAIYIHQKATKLKPLRGKVSIIAHIVTIKSSAKKPWTLAFMWMTLDTHYPTKQYCRPSTGNGTAQWRWIPSAGQCALRHCQNSSETVRRM